ncbi:hypothetical protein HRbin33_01881 [bacterium HR33]|nr:hypothetical protein HRbin33_01881 [bacterium HR33]
MKGRVLPMSRIISWTSGVIVAVLFGCSDGVGPGIEAPQNLTYRLEPSGDPQRPAGLILQWDPVSNPDLAVYRVYSRASSADRFGLRASTTSNTFHDAGVPDLEYYVTAEHVNGSESPPSNVVLIDERLRLEAPAWLKSTSLNGAVHLYWSDNPFKNEPSGFKQYRVYSASYSLDQNLCGSSWFLEGTTVAPVFLVGALTNGVSRCFAVSAESVEGWESLWSPLRADTPRPDARNVLIFPVQVNAARSGFRFFQDVDGDGKAGPLELGIVGSGTSPEADFYVDLDQSGDVFLVPRRSGTEIALYGNEPVEDLTSIDVAPETGYARSAIQAVPGYGYVFRMLGGDQYYRFGAIRVTHVSSGYLIFDWSYQTDPGNPELSVRGGLPAYNGTIIVPRPRP